MSWKVSDPVSERVEFIGLLKSGQRTLTGLCREFGICRTTAYKYARRFEEEGIDGLKERSRAPHVLPRQTGAEIRDLIISARKLHPSWGPRKLKAWLEERVPTLELPYPSTIGDILKRAGLVQARRRRFKAPPVSSPASQVTAPNEEWNADFKGEFRLGNGQYCFPLTVTDACSRFLLKVQALQSTAMKTAKRVFERTFREFGLPGAIRTDNGCPFAGTGLRRLSPLSVWWIKLGIRLVRGRPHHPQDNGRHERMHRTLKAETTRPPAFESRDQQKRFDAFQREYNFERPHEALGQKPPGRFYQASGRTYPARVPEVDYPPHFEVRSVSSGGTFAWHSQPVFVSHSLEGERIGLVEIDDGLWRVYYAHLELGVLDEVKLKGLRTGKVYAMSPV